MHDWRSALVSRILIFYLLFVLPTYIWHSSYISAFDSSASKTKSLQQSYSSYRQLIDALSERISGAEKIAWLGSEVLTDSNLVDALYIASFRGVDVRILLGESKAEAVMSQYPKILSHNIPVKKWENKYFRKWATYLIVDGKLFVSQNPLSTEESVHDSKVQKYGLYEPYSYPLTKTIKSIFYDAFDGKRGMAADRYQLYSFLNPKMPRGQESKKHTLSNSKSESEWTGFETYKYSGQTHRKPTGIARSLPKEPKWKKK